MSTISRFVERCEAYRVRRGIALSYLSRLLFNDGKVIAALKEGETDVTTRRLVRAESLLGEFERALARNEPAESSSVVAV